jgi:hypothetical protein
MTTEPAQGHTPPLSAEGVGRTLDVPGSTVKLWLSTFQVPGARKNSRGWQIDDEGLAVLEAIKGLRDAGAGNETIRRKLPMPTETIGEEQPLAATVDSQRQPAPTVPDDEPERQTAGEAAVAVWAEPVIDQHQLAAAVTEAVTKAIVQQTELAEKYARVAHRVGELEAKLSAREEGLLEERTRRETAEQRVTALEAELAAERQRLAAAVDTMAAEQQRLSAAVEAANADKKPFWKFW